MFEMDIGDIMDQIFGGGGVGHGRPGQYHRQRKPPKFKPKGTSARLYRHDHYHRQHCVSLYSPLTHAYSHAHAHAHMHTHTHPTHMPGPIAVSFGVTLQELYTGCVKRLRIKYVLAATQYP